MLDRRQAHFGGALFLRQLFRLTARMFAELQLGLGTWRTLLRFQAQVAAVGLKLARLDVIGQEARQNVVDDLVAQKGRLDGEGGL